MIYNTKNHISMKKIQDLYVDIELLNAKVDEYYLKYGELPILCPYVTSKDTTEFLDIIHSKEESGIALNTKINPNDGEDYAVIDLEKLGGITLNYGYDTKGTDGEDGKTGEYFAIKQSRHIKNFTNPDKYEDEIYVINIRTHQIYFPHGIFVDDIMYYSLDSDDKTAFPDRKGIKVGDYVTYTPPTARVTFNAQETGWADYESSPAILSSKPLFRVLDIKQDGEMELIGVVTSSDPRIHFYGALGYNNAVYTLNKKCSDLYKNDSLGITARSIKEEDITSRLNSYGLSKIDSSMTGCFNNMWTDRKLCNRSR